VLCRVDTDDSRHVRGGFNVDARDESMGMTAAQEGNVQSTRDSAVIGEHALSD
jgi:hypothetical protein